jgi:hypothetical protein
MLSEDERSLPFVAIGFVAVVTIGALELNTRVEALFGEHGDSHR